MIPYLNTCITYLNTLTRLSAFGSRLHILIHALPLLESTFGSISFPTRLGNTLDSRLHILMHCRLGNQAESNTLGSRQKRTLRQPNRQPIRIEHYVTRVVSQSESSIASPESSLRRTRELSARCEVPSRLWAQVGCYSLS